MEKKPIPLVIGIAGGTGSGKTTVVNAIAQNLDSQSMVTIQHDSYYRDRSHLSPLERKKINYDHPDALETDLLVRHLKELITGQKVEIPEYDFATHTRQEKGNIIASEKVIIVEGVLVFTDSELRELFDLKIFTDTDDDIRFIRRLQRDIKERGRNMESVIEQYMETVQTMHNQFVEKNKRYADFVISGNSPIEENINILYEKIRMIEK